jgi:hypothetical protein
LEIVNVPQAGPQLERLLHRLADCPAEFLLPPGEINLTALACDHVRALGLPVPSPAQHRFHKMSAAAQRIAAVVLWLLHDEWFIARPELGGAAWTFLQADGLARLAMLVPAEVAVRDPDRREELVRLCLQGLDLLPKGESAAQAADRLTTLDSVERERIIRQTRQAEARAKEIRAAMARKRAEEAAARYSPE